MTQDYDRYYEDAIANALAGETDAAIEALQTCHRLMPERVEPLLDLLQLYRKQGLATETMATVQTLLARWPADCAVRLAAARVFLDVHRLQNALGMLEGISVDADSLEYPNYLGLLLECGKYEEALQAASMGLDSALWSAQAALSRAIALSRLGRHVEALELFEQLDREEFGCEDQPLRQGLIPAWADALLRVGRRTEARMLLNDKVKQAMDEKA